MSENTISSEQLCKMFLAGAKNLEANKEWINELNVFPVPDGDTGTNMTMTILSAVKEVSALETITMESVSKAISSGSLRGARGNSGVILSQLFRGFAKVVKGYDELDIEILTQAFEKACETAYKAVMKPKEGTILTVAKGVSDKAFVLAGETDDLSAFLDGVVAEAEAVLAKTPDMLPVLKQAGVVDSGGQGLVQVLKGALDAYYGREVDYDAEAADALANGPKIHYMYHACFDAMSQNGFELSDAEENLGAFGKCTVEKKTDRYRVNIETNELSSVVEFALKAGALCNIAITNSDFDDAGLKEAAASMSSNLNDDPKKDDGLVPPTDPEKEVGFVSVSIGDGMNQIFKELGVDYVIEGGQTMNPSTEDVLAAAYRANAKTVFVLPNNKNIILAANQAAMIAENIKIVVIPTKTLPQGITALINYIPDSSVEENAARMTESLATVKTGQLTYAVRDTEIDNKVIHEGDYMGIGDHGIVSVDRHMDDCFFEMISCLIDDDSAIISIYYGSDIKEKDAEKLVTKLTKKYPDLEVELQDGGQPVYYYVVSVE